VNHFLYFFHEVGGNNEEFVTHVLSEALIVLEDGTYSWQHSIFFFLNIVKTDNDVNHFLNHL